ATGHPVRPTANRLAESLQLGGPLMGRLGRCVLFALAALSIYLWVTTGLDDLPSGIKKPARFLVRRPGDQRLRRPVRHQLLVEAPRRRRPTPEGGPPSRAPRLPWTSPT